MSVAPPNAVGEVAASAVTFDDNDVLNTESVVSFVKSILSMTETVDGEEPPALYPKLELLVDADALLPKDKEPLIDAVEVSVE